MPRRVEIEREDVEKKINEYLTELRLAKMKTESKKYLG